MPVCGKCGAWVPAGKVHFCDKPAGHGGGIFIKVDLVKAFGGLKKWLKKKKSKE